MRDTVGQHMTSPPITVTPQAEISEAANLMLEKKIHRLPVVEEGGLLVGYGMRDAVIRMRSAWMAAAGVMQRSALCYESLMPASFLNPTCSVSFMHRTDFRVLSGLDAVSRKRLCNAHRYAKTFIAGPSKIWVLNLIVAAPRHLNC